MNSVCCCFCDGGFGRLILVFVPPELTEATITPANTQIIIINKHPPVEISPLIGVPQ